jgi:hypothetical protein
MGKYWRNQYVSPLQVLDGLLMFTVLLYAFELLMGDEETLTSHWKTD